MRISDWSSDVCSSDLMRRCLTNLIANAQRHGKHIAVRAGRRKGLVEVTIDDDGPGIPPERYDDVFKPFFRLEQSRNPATGGIGLGLTIARDVARSHGGDVTVEAAPGGGLRARIWLPVSIGRASCRERGCQYV